MAELHRARACMVGGEDDMYAVLRAMLRACGEWNDDEEAPPMKMEDMLRAIRRVSKLENGDEDGFVYEMVCPAPYGSAEGSTTRFEVTQHPCGLWTALFCWDSYQPFQPEDWLSLHRRSGRVPVVALYASHAFALEKGAALLSNEQMLDSWDTMNELWLWLIARYECGYPPEEAVARLKKLQVTMEQEGCEVTVEELLESCEDNLRELGRAVEDQAQLAAALEEAARAGNWREYLACEIHVAESALWETEHNQKWLAQLEAVRAAWRQHA